MAEKPERAKRDAAAKRSAAAVGGAVAAKANRSAPIAYPAEEVAEIFRRWAVQRPEPKSELEYSNAFTLLVAVVLSAQMTDTGVNRATRGLFAEADNPRDMAALGEAAIDALIATVGFHRTKAKNVAALSRILLAEHGGEVPRSREALEALPGVGRKTASVVLNNAFGEDTLAVDTHIFRLGNRLKIAPGKTPEAVEQGFLRVVPERYLHHAHHWILLHGRYVCKARVPDCGLCVIADLCRADEKWNAVPAPLEPIPVRPSGLQGAPEARVASRAAGPRPPAKRVGGDGPSAPRRRAASGD